jgi:hypothetical protein
MNAVPSLSVPSAEDLMREARERTGLADFGPPTFREGLERFLQSMRESEARYFTQEGVARLTPGFVDKLVARLQVEDWYAKHPEVEAEQPERPLLITGLPRTGTSAFASILSLEPSFRCLRPWETGAPTPAPSLETEATDPRRLAAQKGLEEMQRRDPGAMMLHLHELDATTEDVPLLQYEFKAQTFTAPAFGYHAWWRESDMRPAYAYQRRIVKLLQSRRKPNRWLFKAPHYVFHLPAVMSAYPDARFVVTHRDPVKTLPSWASFLSILYPPGSLERVTPQLLGAKVVEHQEIGMRRLVEDRAVIGDDRFLDVHHHEFVADPIGVVKRVYDFVGFEFTKGAQDRMLDWSEKNKPGAHGKHHYTAAQFGMDEHEIRERFGFYTDKYDVRLEKIGG